MKLLTKLRDTKHHVDVWLTIFQGGINITTREKEILAEFIIAYLYHKSKGLIEPYLSKEVFDTEVRKAICETLSISSFNLTNVLAALRAKGCIKDDKINPQLIPEKELIFEFR